MRHGGAATSCLALAAAALVPHATSVAPWSDAEISPDQSDSEQLARDIALLQGDSARKDGVLRGFRNGHGHGSLDIQLVRELFELHIRCQSSFSQCWKNNISAWQDADDCSDRKAKCQQVLCSSWLGANCAHGEQHELCEEVDGMCAAEASSNSTAVDVSSLPMTTIDMLSKRLPPLEEERLVFLHIPKSAGTAIENAGLAKRVRWGRHRFFYYGMMAMPDGLYCAAHHVPPRHLPKSMGDIYRKSDVFCVTRHPYERAISEYKYLLSVPWGQNKPGVLDREPCTPEGLNHFLKTAMRMVLSGRKYVNDCHMLPQSEFIWDEQDHQVCNKVLRFEDMPHAFNNLMADTGYSVRSDHSENQSPGCPTLSMASLEDETRILMNKVYAEDFRRLAYSTTIGGSPSQWPMLSGHL